jgi:hypothetical protein
MSGADWLLGDTGKKKAAPKLVASGGIEVTPDEVDAVLADVAGAGKKLRAGIDAAVSQLEAIKKCGLTGEALVLLVEAKCARAKNGSRISADTVQLVLEGLFRLGEHTR